MTALNCIVFIVAVVALMLGGARVKLRAPSLAARTVRKNDSGLVLEFDDFGRLPPPVVDVFRAVYSVGKEYVYEGATYRLAERGPCGKTTAAWFLNSTILAVCRRRWSTFSARSIPWGKSTSTKAQRTASQK